MKAMEELTVPDLEARRTEEKLGNGMTRSSESVEWG